MGNVTSKKQSVVAVKKTPEKGSSVAAIEQSPTTTDKATIAFEPKTPAIPQTPLTQTIASHLNRITKNETNHNTNIKTPSYLLRKKILYDLGYTYPIKETDPRSPTQCIPRTPLNLSESAVEVTERETSSFQYNSTLEDSCREFNLKLDDITLDDETEAIEQNNLNDQKQNASMKEANNDTPDAKIQTNETTSETQASLCAKKTPDFENTPNAENQPEMKSKVIGQDDKEKETNLNVLEKSIEQNNSMVSTPLTNKSLRTGRIPLSVINRRAGTNELTPLQSKNTSGVFSIEKNRKNLSFNTHDENRGSARKSKIPVFKKLSEN